jgi:hypothetical protein
MEPARRPITNGCANDKMPLARLSEPSSERRVEASSIDPIKSTRPSLDGCPFT